MRILFVTTTNLASNPRLLKEIDLATSLGFEVELIQFNLGNWSDVLTEQIKKEYWRCRFVERYAGRKPFFPWFVSSLLQWIFGFLPLKILSSGMLSISLDKRSYLIQKSFRALNSIPDLVIAHNPGSFYPALYLAEKLQIQFAVDIEDYHPGETNNFRQAIRMKELMFRILPKAKYVSFASKLIMKQVESDFHIAKSPIKNSILIDNLFPKSEFVELEKFILDKNKINFVWFSQNIDYSRGLESIFAVLDEFQVEVSLTLIGNIRHEFYQNEIAHRSYILVEEPKAQKALHRILPNFDVGLALETKVSNSNRDICLTNKIWAYMQSGVYILASGTKAQIAFMHKFPKSGEVIVENLVQAKHQVKNLIREKLKIREGINERRMLNNVVNWEKESCKLKSVW